MGVQRQEVGCYLPGDWLEQGRGRAALAQNEIRNHAVSQMKPAGVEAVCISGPPLNALQDHPHFQSIYVGMKFPFGCKEDAPDPPIRT